MENLTQYAFMYCAVDAMLLLFAIAVYRTITQDFGSEEEAFRFKQLTGAFIVYIISDYILGLAYGNFIVLGYYTNMIVVYANLVCLGLVAYLWFRYAFLRIAPNLDSNRVLTVITSIPIIVLILALSSSVFEGEVFVLVDGGGFKPSDYFLHVLALGAVYLVVITILAVVRYFGTPERSARSRWLWMAVFVIPPLVAVACEVLIPETPILGMGFFCSIALVFFFYQTGRIYDDVLTQLNNRRRVDEFIEQRTGTDDMMFYLFDINRFKEINDRFGHIEGDHALCHVADAMRVACAGRQAIAGRYGGDEFVIVEVLGEVDGYNPQELIDVTRAALQKISLEKDLPYLLTVSAGYAYISTDELIGYEGAYNRADAMMYEEKQRITRWPTATMME